MPRCAPRSRKGGKQRGILCGRLCSAAAPEPTAPPTASVPTKATIPANFRFWILDFGLELKLDSKDRLQNLLFIYSSPQSKIQNRKSKIYFMTLSARYSTDCGIVRPICFAVLRLMTSSNFVGCSTGISAGLVPLRILSTINATRR
jgi:hypothetical protein